MGVEIDIPVPSTIGPGAAVDVSGVNTNLLILNPFAGASDVVVVEQTFDPAGLVGWMPLFTLNNGPQAVAADIEGLQIRARRINGSGGAYNLQAVSQQVGTAANFNLAIPATGASGVQDISGQPQWLSLFLDNGQPNETAQLQISIDGTNFVPFATLQGATSYELVCGANKLKVVRLQGGTAGTLRGNGIPAKG